MSPDSSALSDAPQPPNKRRRSSGSESSLSSADDQDEDDEDEPLASLTSRTSIGYRPQASKSSRIDARARNGHRSGKKMSSMKSVAQTAPASHSQDPQHKFEAGGHVNGSHSAEIRVDEHIDERQLTRLATGVTVDTGASAPTPVS